MNDRPLPNGWRLSEPYSESKQGEYVKRVTEELAAIPRMKIPPTKTQTPATQALLDAQKSRPEWQDEEYIRDKWAKDFPEHAQVRNPDGSVNTGERQLGIQETLLVEDIRHKGRNTLGQSAEGSVSKEKRQKGIEAFTYSKPANPTEAEIARLKKLEPMEAVVVSVPVTDEKPNVSWWNRLRWTLFSYEGESLESFLGRHK